MDKELFNFVKDVEASKVDAARFSPFWNEIVKNLREEDYISNLWVLEPLYAWS